MPARLPRSLFALLVICGCTTAPSDPLSPGNCHYEATAAAVAGTPLSSGGPGPVRAGVGEAPLDLPVGTPLGGYSARISLLGGTGPDGRRNDQARAFAPSGGLQTRPLARALFLQAGGEPLLLIKADLCVAFDRLVQDLEQALSAEGPLAGRARGHIILATSHTHSGFGTFQQVFHLQLGFDLFQEAQYQRLLASLVRAARQAIAAAVPAQIGAGVWEGWDDKDEIFGDRRGEDDVLKGPDGQPVGKHKDGRLLVVRVDAAPPPGADGQVGKPLAVLFNFPMHGTVSGADNPLHSVDAPGHVELALEERFDHPVLTMHLQGPAGDASPRGVGGLGQCDGKKQVCTNFARMEALGELAAPRIYDLWQKIETVTTADLGMLTRTVPYGRAISVRGGQLSYAPYDDQHSVDSSPQAIFVDGHPENGLVRSPITQFNVPVGAGLCGSKSPTLPVAGIDGAAGVPYGSCAEIGAALHLVAGLTKTQAPPLPECEATRTTISALRLSGLPVLRRQAGADTGHMEDLLLLTLPGEPLSLYAEKLRARSPLGADRTFVLGYAQGHVGYLMEAENWLLGGYEPSINIYGPLEGEWLLERSLDLAQLFSMGTHPDAGQGGDRLAVTPGPLQQPGKSPSPQAGQVPGTVPADLFVRTRVVPSQAQPQETVPRLSGRATFVFAGGDPVEDTPEVGLQREDPAGSGSYKDVTRHNGRPLSSRGREMILTYTPEPVTALPEKVEQHLWAVEWQAVGWDRDQGTAGLSGALSIPTGRYRFAVSGKADGKQYMVQSRPFSVVSEGALSVQADRSGQTVSGHAVYPVGAGYRLLRLSGPSDGDVPAAGMLTVRVRGHKDGTTREFSAPAAADGGFSVQADGVDLSGGADLTVLDPVGSSGQALLN